MIRTLKIAFAALLLGAFPAQAQDMHQAIAGIYGQSSGVPGNSASSRRKKSVHPYHVFMYGKWASYEHRMARWNEYCDNRGDGAAMISALVRAGTSLKFIPVIGDFMSLVEREGQKVENSCHGWRSAFMTRYERDRTLADNRALVAAIDEAVGKHVQAIVHVQDKQVTPEVVQEIVRRTVEQQRQMIIEEMRAATEAAKQKTPAPKQEKKPEDTSKQEVPAAQAPKPPAATQPAEKPAAEKKEDKPAAEPGKGPPAPAKVEPSSVPKPPKKEPPLPDNLPDRARASKKLPHAVVCTTCR